MELTIVMRPTDRMPLGLLLIFVCAIVFFWNTVGLAEDGSRPRARDTSRGLPLPSRMGDTESDVAGRGKTIASSSNIWSTTLSLGLIVGVLVLVGRGMKRFGFQATPTLPIEAFEMLGRRLIEPRVAVHLVKCGSRVLVLGVSSEGIRTLSEVDDPAEVERLTEACQKPPHEKGRGTTHDRLTTAGPIANSSAAVHRVFMAVVALGLSSAAVSPLDAQTTRTGSVGMRSRDLGEPRPAAPADRANAIQPAAFERVLPFEIDPPQFGSPQQLGLTLKMMALMTIFSLAPSILMMTTCFVRFVVSLGLLRQALGTQQGPPNQVLTAICLFLTFLVMSPIWQRCYNEGIRPYTNPAPGEPAIDEATALALTIAPAREFMSQQIDKANNAEAVWMLLDFQRPAAGSATASTWHEPQSYDEVPLTVLAPAYLLSELKVGFLIGFQLFLPFLVIDLVVAMTLTSLGLTMLPPSMVSLPFKLLLFVLIDGWFLTVGMLLESVRIG